MQLIPMDVFETYCFVTVSAKVLVHPLDSIDELRTQVLETNWQGQIKARSMMNCIRSNHLRKIQILIGRCCNYNKSETGQLAIQQANIENTECHNFKEFLWLGLEDGQK